MQEALNFGATLTEGGFIPKVENIALNPSYMYTSKEASQTTLVMLTSVLNLI